MSRCRGQPFFIGTLSLLKKATKKVVSVCISCLSIAAVLQKNLHNFFADKIDVNLMIN